MSTLLRSLMIDAQINGDVGEAAAEPPSATDAVRQFYAACHLRKPRVLVARSPGHYKKSIDNIGDGPPDSLVGLMLCAALYLVLLIGLLLSVPDSLQWIIPHISETSSLLILSPTLLPLPIAIFLWVRRHPFLEKTPTSMLGVMRAACVDCGCSVPGIPERIQIANSRDRGSLYLRFGLPTGLNPMRTHLQKLEDSLAELEQLSNQERKRLPLVLQHAIALRSVTRGVFLTDGIAVILPLGDAELTPRQQRKQVAEAIEEPDPRIREIEMRRLGLEHTVNCARLRSVHSDETGNLYRIGISTAPVCLVRVRDTVRGDDGLPLVHWLSVPAYITTAREGVAWSYKMAAHEYAPLVRE